MGSAATLMVHPQLNIGLRPPPGHLFVKLDPPKETSDGGVIIPPSLRAPTSQGEVVAVGSDLTDFDGSTVGFRVALTTPAGVQLCISAPNLVLPEEMVVVKEGEINAVWDGHRLRLYADSLPHDSLARRWCPVGDTVLIRTYSPASVYTGGLIAAKDERFPKIWAHLLTVPWDLWLKNTALVPGRMVVFSRFADELLGYDRRKDGRNDLPVAIVAVTECKCVFYDPIPAELEVD